MNATGIILCLIGFFVAAGVALWAARRQQEAAIKREELEKKLSEINKARKRAESDARKANEQIVGLEKALAEATARRDEKAMAAVMWELELARTYRDWHDVVSPEGDNAMPLDGNAGYRLSHAVGHEVDRLREEVGVSISHDGVIDLDLEAEIALGALRICEELLALAAKQSDEVSVSLDQSDEPAVLISVSCKGWETGTAQEADLESVVEAMAKRLDGDVTWRRPVAGSGSETVITIRLPA